MIQVVFYSESAGISSVDVRGHWNSDDECIERIRVVASSGSIELDITHFCASTMIGNRTLMEVLEEKALAMELEDRKK